MTQQLQITVSKLYEEIGRLTVENAVLRQQLAASQARVPVTEAAPVPVNRAARRAKK